MRPSIFDNDNPRPVSEILGVRTRWVLAEPDRVESFIIAKPRQSRGRGIEGYTILARGPELTLEQTASLQKIIFEPLSYYYGRPIFRRFPSVPNFAFRLHREESTLYLLVDLHNPGWELYCQTERYCEWNWVGYEMATLAKALFPKYASENPGSMWKLGAIKRMKETEARQTKEHATS